MQDQLALVDSFSERRKQLERELAKVVVGQREVLELLQIAIFSGGHCLLVGVPGLAKTLIVNTLSKALGLSFSRVQFTPDLMPSDIIGAEVLDENRSFKYIKGPIFTNILLADEINRTPPKTQSALLECMQEKAVTIGGQTWELPSPFFVLATQNPIEQEGTYPLPEAQQDRFMFNVVVDYPSFEEELKVIKQTTSNEQEDIEKVMSAEEIIAFQELVRSIPVADNVLSFAVSLAHATRPGQEKTTDLVNEYVSWGAGPRASQHLVVGAKCYALMQGKLSPDREDIVAVAKPILRHRIVRNYKAEAEGISTEDIIDQLVSKQD